MSEFLTNFIYVLKAVWYMGLFLGVVSLVAGIILGIILKD